MKQNKYNLSNVGLLLASFASLLVLATAPVYADNGTETEGNTTTTTTTTSTEDTNSGDTTDSNTGDLAETQRHGPDVPDWNKHAKSELALLRQHISKNHRQKSADLLKKLCERRQNAASNRLSAYNNHASIITTHLNDLFTKVQAYQTSKKLNVPNYDTLVANVKTKQAAAAAAVTSLKGLQVSCNTSDPAVTFQTVKDGASSTRDALKAYRVALKDLVVALLKANAQANAQAGKTTTTTTEGN